jgi:hypothetical protein
VVLPVCQEHSNIRVAVVEDQNGHKVEHSGRN